MDDFLHLKPRGRICLGEGLPAFQQMVSDALLSPQPLLLLELADVDYIDSSGLGEILKLFLESRKKGKKLSLINPSLPIRKILRSSKLDRVFTIADSVAQATGTTGPETH